MLTARLARASASVLLPSTLTVLPESAPVALGVAEASPVSVRLSDDVALASTVAKLFCRLETPPVADNDASPLRVRLLVARLAEASL